MPSGQIISTAFSCIMFIKTINIKYLYITIYILNVTSKFHNVKCAKGSDVIRVKAIKGLVCMKEEHDQVEP